MPRTFVALDLETTGLDANHDAIIEVGAIKYRDGVAVEEFSSLINPGRPIPAEITQLTGISDRDVLGKPTFEQISAPLLRLAGGLPIVGHSIGFDLGFLRARGLLNDNVGLDTWEMASILLPSLPGYSLSALADTLGLNKETRHRALEDARTSALLFEHLVARAARLPRPVLGEIVRVAKDTTWPLAEVFSEALLAGGLGRMSARDGHEARLEDLAPASPLFIQLQAGEPLAPKERTERIATAELAALLGPQGAFARAFAGYEHRPQQVAMLEAVAGAFNQGHHLLAEAGTGTGKSVAYLLPAIAFAVKNNTRVVVSTNTINLQDQLFRKDLPDLQRLLADAWGADPPFRAALLKGRGNYLCPRRFATLKARQNLSHDELRGLARILVWLPGTQTGDAGELSLPQPADRQVWSQVSSENEGCSVDRCQRDQRGACFFYRAHKQAEAAHILVVNHALLLADAATDYHVLPEYRHLIVDEAHHLEDAVTEQLSFRADSYTLGQVFHSLHVPGAAARTAGGEGPRRRVTPRSTYGADAPKAGGVLGELSAGLRGHIPMELYTPIQAQIVRLTGEVETVQTRLGTFWEALDSALQTLQPRSDASEYGQRIRVTPGVRAQPVWVEVEVAWENLALLWSGLSKRLGSLSDGLADVQSGGFEAPALEPLVEDLASALRRLDELYAALETWVMKPQPNGVYWIEVADGSGRSRRVTLRAAPLHVGPLVQEHILFHSETVVMTSATLRTGGSFDYVRGRLQADEADTVTVGSPFDYRASTLLYLPSDLPEPNASNFQTAVEQALIGLGRALGGRMLALFTANAQLRRTAQAIGPALTEAGVQVLSQGGGGSRHQLLEVFKTDSRTVLLGTRSFWEGVDVVGPALSALVLVRLPFAVPSDPVVAARSETFDDPFTQYQVPDAILRFRQGFGRLIRSKTDRGVVVVLDKRVTSKGYGQTFLDSLPECTVQRGPLMNLPAAAKAWVARA